MAEFNDVYLRFTDGAEAMAELAVAGIASWGTTGIAVDPVGTVWSAPVLDGNGDVVTPAAALPGWHVNLRLTGGSLPDSLTPFLVSPTVPYRRFV